MPDLRTHDWADVYESRPSDADRSLVDDFYVPALSESVRYDRIAGYFSSGSLAVAAEGIEALADNDGTIRLLVGAELYETDRPVLEALADELGDRLETLDDERLDATLQLLAHYLREERLTIRVAVPREGDWGIFHPKLGLFHDAVGNVVSFEGSVNETLGGWERNFERFKLHRSWVDGQADYVAADTETFERLWTDDHPAVAVYDLPTAVAADLIDWKAPDTDTQLERAAAVARGDPPPTELDAARIVRDGHRSPGGLALADHRCTVDPWPHQRVVTDTLVSTYPQSFLLCDEVGLGKTIEAGLTLTRLAVTDELQSGLLLVPASLTVQWQEELWEKFGIDAVRFDRASDGSYAFHDVHGVAHDPPAVDDLDLDADERQFAWTDSPLWRYVHARQTAGDDATIVILSWHTARMDGRWDQVAPRDGGETRTRADVPPSCRGRDDTGRNGVWDAVVVDEAHNARRGSQFYGLLDRTRAHTHAVYLLTATPMQLDTGELYDLLRLADLPPAWDDRDQFVEFFETRTALTDIVDTVVGEVTVEESDDAGDATGETGDSQATLDMRHQGRLPVDDRSVADRVLGKLASELGLTAEARGGAATSETGSDEDAIRRARERVIDACRLAAAFGATYDGYDERLDSVVTEFELDALGVHDDDRLATLLYTDERLDAELLTAGRTDRHHAVEDLGADGWRGLTRALADATPVDALIHRNTRETLRRYEEAGVVDTTVPTRTPIQRQIELTPATREVYDQIKEYTEEFYRLATQGDDADTRAVGFVMTTYRQRLTSSIYAIAQSLQRRLNRLESEREVLDAQRRAEERDHVDAGRAVREAVAAVGLDDLIELDEVVGDVDAGDLASVLPDATEDGLALLDREIDRLSSFVDDLREVDSDPKIRQLRSDLDALSAEGHNRVVVFTQYTDTMDFVRDRLVATRGETVATYSGRGGAIYDATTDTWESVGKEHVKQAFADDDDEVSVLICTDSASEGLNLQTCGALVNYDLPWNPMRVEQRIGRIDRIGQQYDDVRILNYSYTETVETDIYERLGERIGLFESVVGEMQPILSGVSRQFRDATLGGAVEDRSEAVEQLDEEIDRAAAEVSDDPDLGLEQTPDSGSTEADIVEAARLDAWQSTHPDLVDHGASEYAFRPAFGPDGLTAFLVDNETLRSAGVTFEPVSVADTGDVSPAETYRLRADTDAVDLPATVSEGSLADSLAPGANEHLVTFDRETAGAFPSASHLAPGTPLLADLVAVLVTETETPARLTAVPEATANPVVRAWGRDGDWGRLDDDGTPTLDGAVSRLEAWRATFESLREEDGVSLGE